jgi:hypothetical protein
MSILGIPRNDNVWGYRLKKKSNNKTHLRAFRNLNKQLGTICQEQNTRPQTKGQKQWQKNVLSLWK